MLDILGLSCDRIETHVDLLCHFLNLLGLLWLAWLQIWSCNPILNMWRLLCFSINSVSTLSHLSYQSNLLLFLRSIIWLLDQIFVHCSRVITTLNQAFCVYLASLLQFANSAAWWSLLLARFGIIFTIALSHDFIDAHQRTFWSVLWRQLRLSCFLGLTKLLRWEDFRNIAWGEGTTLGALDILERVQRLLCRCGVITVGDLAGDQLWLFSVALAHLNEVIYCFI